MQISVRTTLQTRIEISSRHARTKMLSCPNREIYTRPSISTTKCGTLKTQLDVNVRYAYLRSIGRMAALRGDGAGAMIGKDNYNIWLS
jgi:hypothetical protein